MLGRRFAYFDTPAAGRPRLACSGRIAMHLGGAVLTALALLAAQHGSAPGRGTWGPICVSIGAGAFLVVFAAAAISGLTAAQIRQNPTAVRDYLRRYSRLRVMHTSLWFVVSFASVVILNWPQRVPGELFPRFILLDELLVVLPVLLPMFFSYAAFFEVDRAAGRAFGSSAVMGRLRDRWSYAWWFVRHEFGLVVVPLGILALVQDVAEASLGPAGQALDGPLVGLSLFAFLMTFPLWLRAVWPCESLQDVELSRSIALACQDMDVSVPRVFEWKTGGRIVNAVVSGTLPGTHCVLLSDVLLKHFTHDEVVAVVRHEVAHVKRHHVLLRIAALATPLVACYAAGVPEAVPKAYERLVGLRPSGVDVAIAAAVAAGLAAYLRWAFGGFSRLLEFEADLLACRESLGRPAADGRTRADRAAAAQSALYKLGCVYGFDRRNWMHPTTNERLRVLRAAARQQQIGGRLLARVQRAKLSILAASLAALVAAVIRASLDHTF
jgi:Zn-dependent protease with chaperone function